MKKLIAILLVLCFMFLALVACGKKETGETEPSETKDTSNTSDTLDEDADATLSDTDIYGQNLLNSAINIEEHDYEGKELFILVRDSITYYREWYKKDTDSPDTDPELDEAVVQRNSIVEADLNVKPVMVYEKTGGSFNADYNALIYSDVFDTFHQYDIVNNYAYFSTDASVRGAYANVNDQTMFPYFNFKLPCWNQALVKNCKLNDKIYMLAGDVNLSLFDLATVMWVNLDLYASNKKASDPEDIQQHAIDGNWVYTDLYSWALRTDNTDTKTVCGDFHGFSTGFHFFDTLPHAWDLKFVVEDNEGRHSFNIENNTKAEDALGTIRNIVNAPGCAPMHNQNSDLNVCKCGLGLIGHFTDGDYAFIAAPLYGSEDQNMKIRNMTDKYGILPIPQYEAKAGYKTTSGDYYNLMAVLNHNDNLDNPTNGDAVSVYLQYVNEKSYTDVREMYFERVIRSKTFGTDEAIATKSIELFNTIVDGISLTVDTIYSRSLNDIGWLWRDNILRGGTTSLGAAFLENTLSGGSLVKNKEQYEQAIADFDAWIFDEQ